MATLLIRHKVKDYATWKALFDRHAPARKAAGATGAHLFRNNADPNEVIVAINCSDLDRMRAFAASEDLKAAMAEGGVADKPDAWFLDDAGRTEA